ncbi:MAG: energy transducer TonB [Paludibacteraceae bacterium]|nr:energy transducer TonB [Paludibacteraceae bacterium]
MKSKKSEKASLEKNKIIYVLMGLIFVLSICFIAFEWGDEVKKIKPISNIFDGITEEMDIQPTKQEIPLPPPPKMQEVEALVVVDDDKEVESLDIKSEDDQSEEIIIAPPVENIIDEPEDDDVPFLIVEKMPEFPGGQQALFKYLSENVKYPVIAQENGIQGKVVCQFVVNKDGSIVDVVVVRSGGDPSLDKEAVRVIKSMPKWNPGKQSGKTVRVKYTVPVNFKLQ